MKLLIDDAFPYRLFWYDPVDQEPGSTLGDQAYREPTLKDLEKQLARARKNYLKKPTSDTEGNLQHAAAELAASRTAGVEWDGDGFSWPTVTAARKAIKAVKAAIKAEMDNRPLQDWEVQALAAGWKPPAKRG